MQKEDVREEEGQVEGEVIQIAYPPHLHFLIIDELPYLKKEVKGLTWNPHRKGRLWLRGTREQLKKGEEKFLEVLMRLEEQDAIDARKFREHLVSGGDESEAGSEPVVVASYGCDDVSGGGYKAEAGEEEEEEEEEDEEGTVEVVEVEDEEEEEKIKEEKAEQEWKPVVVASYSWDMAEEKPEYSIPGYLRTYKAPKCPLKLDAGSVRRETNIEMRPRMELIPLACSVIDPQFSLLDYDVVTDRNNLRKIFRWACGSTKRWSIDLEKVGPDTIVMTSFDLTEEDEATCIKERKLRGFRFEDVCCQKESTTSYRAVLAFTKANTNFLMRCEIDATQDVVQCAPCETCLDPSCLIEYKPHTCRLVDSFVELKSIREHRFSTDYVKPDDVDQEQPSDDIEMKDIWFQAYIAGVAKIVFGLKTKTNANDEVSKVNSLSPAQLLKKFQIDPSKELERTMRVVRFAKEHILRRTDGSHYSLVFEPNEEELAIRLYRRANNTGSGLQLTKWLEEQPPLVKSERRKGSALRMPIPAYICDRSKKAIRARLPRYCNHSRAAFTCRNSRRHDCWRLVRQTVRAIQEEDRRKISELIPEGQLSPIVTFHKKLKVQQTSGTPELHYCFKADWKVLYVIFKILPRRDTSSANWWRIDLTKTGADTATMDLSGQANPLPDRVFQTVGDGEGTFTFSTNEMNLLVQCATPICGSEVMYRATVTAENPENRAQVLRTVWFQAKLAGVQLVELVPDRHGEPSERISLTGKLPFKHDQKQFDRMLAVLRSVAKCMADEPIGAQFSLVYTPEVRAIQLWRRCEPHELKE